MPLFPTAFDASQFTLGILAAARGGTGVANTGTLTNASNTTITGGGTLALGGFTLTVPATGTAALLGVANVFSANNRFNAKIGVGRDPAASATVDIEAITWIRQPTNGADGIRILRADDTAPSGTLILGMNAANNDEFWRFDADGNFIVVDIDGDNLATIARQDDAVYLDLTRSTNTGTVIFGKVFGDTQARLLIRADGLHEWGAGGASARDTNLYRGGASILQTDDTFLAPTVQASTRVQIGGSTDSVPLALNGTNGELRMSTVLTDATNKTGRMTVKHYTNSEEPTLAFLLTVTSTTAGIQWGGGSSVANAATGHQFYSAADNITTTGTQRAAIGDGMAIGDALAVSSTAQLLIKANADARIGLAVRANSASQSSNLQAWQNSSGTALAFVTPGGGFVFNETAADVDCRIEGDTDANLFYTDASADAIGIGTATPASKLHALLSDATTNAVGTVLTLGHNSTGTAAAGFGGALLWTLESSTTNDQSAASWDALWATATHASRKARIVGNVYDTAVREWIRGEASGSAAMIGFLGAGAIIRQTVAADATDLASAITLVNDIKAKLSAAASGFGLFT